MKKIIILMAASVLAAGSAFAQQSFRSAYFLDGYNHRHEFNPAFASRTSYFSVPVISAFNLETQSNLGVSTFLYPVNGKLTTFMNSSVSADEFLGKLDPENRLNLNNRNTSNTRFQTSPQRLTADWSSPSATAVRFPTV